MTLPSKKNEEAFTPRYLGPVLKVIVDDSHVASIYKEAEEYCLVYKDAFQNSGLMAFNPNDVGLGGYPLVNHVYRSPELWQSLASRIPSPNRDDYKELLASSGLIGNEDSLTLLGKLGRLSIAKRWKLEIENPKV